MKKQEKKNYMDRYKGKCPVMVVFPEAILPEIEKAAKENGTKRSVFLRNLLTTYFSVRAICGQNPPWDEFTPKTSPERLFIVDKADEKFTMVRLMSGIYLFKIKDEEIWGGDDNLKYIPVRWQNKIIGFMVKA